jgi:hypothetical protein
MAALKTSPRAGSYLQLLRSEREAAKAPAFNIEPEPETTGASARQVPEVKPQVKKPEAQSARARPVPRQRPAYAQQRQQPAYAQQHQQPAYGQQPFFGGYRPMY